MRIDALSKSYGQQTLFREVDYAFPNNERIALIGANGAGKTTLLNILCGIDAADSGAIHSPKDQEIGYLPQSPNPAPLSTVLKECEAGASHLVELQQKMLHWQNACGDMEAAQGYAEAESRYSQLGGYALESRAISILSGLGFSQDDFTKSPLELSGGWRMRLELARLFIKEPDFLILDEPTNHLDLPSLVWVEAWLKSFKGTLLFVSHDRALLNRLSSLTLHLHGGILKAYRGNFDKFLKTREEQQVLQQKRAANLEQKREHMEKFVERFGAKATKATQAQSRVKMIAKIRALEEGLDIDNDLTSLCINIPAPQKTPRIVLSISEGSIGYERPLATGITLCAQRGHKIAIIGANGIGKSTLLKTICGIHPKLGGQFDAAENLSFAYYAQDQLTAIDLQKTVLDNILYSTKLGDRDARSLLGSFMFRNDDVDKKASSLSGGELSRLGLSRALGLQTGLLVLDEPTNHLDMTSVEVLADSLASYEGNILFVSHDRSFIDSFCTHVFAMLPDGRSMLFEGNLEDYRRQAALADFPNVLEIQEGGISHASDKSAIKSATVSPNADSSKQPSQGRYAQSKAEKKAREKLVRKIARCEKELDSQKTVLQSLESEMRSASPLDHNLLAELGEKDQNCRGSIDALEHEWLELSEELETLA